MKSKVISSKFYINLKYIYYQNYKLFSSFNNSININNNILNNCIKNIVYSKPLLLKSTIYKQFSTKIGTIKKNLQNDDKIGLMITLEDNPGSLLNILKILNDYDVNLSFINSKPSPKYSSKHKKVDIFIDVENKNQSCLLKALSKIKEAGSEVKFTNIQNVPWFPKNFIDLNLMGTDIKQGGVELASDHPGFNDKAYKLRRSEIESISSNFQFSVDNRAPIIEYTKEETELWGFMWDKLLPLIRKHACEEFNNCMDVLIENRLFSKNKVPQIQEFNEFYSKTTNMFLRPTGGLLSEREFLNSLAFRVFPSTQYIRHSSMPLYTPEPDLIHEFIGHAAMLSNKEFVEFSQQIGLASLGASDEDIQKLSTIYWYSIEFGLCFQNGKKKIYGGGIISSPSEIEHSMSDVPKILDFDLDYMSTYPVDITNIQQTYFMASSFKDMVKKVKQYSENIKKPFNVRFNEDSRQVDIDRRIVV